MGEKIMKSTMSLKSAKNVGGIGSLLLVISGCLTLGTSIVVVGLLVTVGIILILVALEGMASIYEDRKIFRYALYALIAGAVGIAVFYVTATLTLNALKSIANEHITDLHTIISQSIASSNLMLASEAIVLFVFTVLTMSLLKISLGRLSTKSHVNLFGITGWLMLIGGIITAIIVNPVLLWIGAILLTIAFFSVEAKQTQPPNAKPL